MIVAGIPAFNEEKTIAKVVIHAGKHVDKVPVLGPSVEFVERRHVEELG